MKFFQDKVSLILGLFFLLAVAAYATTSYKVFDLQDKNKQLTTQIASKETELNNQESEIKELLNPYPYPSSGKSYEENYSFQTFGLNSPLFENKKVGVSPTTYKRNNILTKTLSVTDEKTGQEVNVTVWINRGTIKNAPLLPPTFYDPGYEGSEVISFDDFIAKIKETHKSPEGFTMYWSYAGGPHGGIYGQKLTFIKLYSPLGQNLIVQLYTGASDDPGAIKANNYPTIAQARQTLIKIADTIKEQ